MRPVDRGEVPVDEQDNPKVFSAYGQARRDLITRIGEYCSYCETELGASLAVEHVQPKALNPEIELDWTNFLLACTNCNSTKSDKPVILGDYFWPDRDNTFRAFVYETGGAIRVNPALSVVEQERAQRMIDLVGLNKIPGNDPEASDRRWENRLEAWGMAQRAREHVQSLPDDRMREVVVDVAIAKGFWSVWMTVFRGDTIMCHRFIQAFAGTSVDCFDVNTNPIPRPNGSL